MSGAAPMVQARLQQLGAAAIRHERWLVPVVLAGSALLLLLALVLPGSTFSGMYSNDLMIFLDGAYRVLSGQVPNRDFHTPLGALTLLLPAFGLWMAGLGGMMPWATAAFTALFLPFLVYVCRSRLPLLYALGFGFYAILLVIGPVNVGEQLDQSTFAMFYNRFGYALLSLLFLLALPPISGVRRPLADAAVAAGLLLLMFYLKISYFILGAVFLVGMALLTRFRLPALGALLAAAVGAAVIELLWGGTATYFADIGLAAEASGAVRGTLYTLSRIVLLNFIEVIIFLGAIGIALVRGVSWRMLLLCLYMAAAGVLLVNQNAQVVRILTLIPAALVALLSPGREEGGADPFWPRLAGALLIAPLVIPPAAVSFLATGYFAIRSARAPSGSPYEARVAGVIADEGVNDAFKVGPDVHRAAYRTGRVTLEMYNKIRNQRFKQVFSQPEYLRTVEDGLRLLGSDPRLSGNTFVFDMGNPFNALLRRDAPKGVDAWNHNGRTITATLYRAPQEMFADVDIVMVPKVSTELSTTQLLQKVYGDYLRAHYAPAAETDYWRAYRRRS